MINVKSFINSLKISWIRRLLNEGKENWKLIISQNLEENKLINLGTNYIHKIIPIINNPFWTDVLKAYVTFTEKVKRKALNSFFEMPIFNNPEIKLNHECIFWKEWINKGIYYINDIVTDNLSFYQFNEFKRIYNTKTDFVSYNGLICQLKKIYRSIIKENEINVTNKIQYPHIPRNVQIIKNNVKRSKSIYRIMINNNTQPISKAKWGGII